VHEIPPVHLSVAARRRPGGARRFAVSIDELISLKLLPVHPGTGPEGSNMQGSRIKEALITGLFLLAGLAALGYLLGSSAIRFKQFERTVTVKGLAEKEVPADVAVWPIQFTAADNDLVALYAALERDTGRIMRFLEDSGFDASEITVSTPSITDKIAQQYGNETRVELRYTAIQGVTVYSRKPDRVRVAMNRLVELGKQGIVLSGGGYQASTQYLFTKLNDLKPQMIEEATRNARVVAEKFARDSSSRLGKIKSARQGQFTIADRDSSTPYIKNVRVVSTVEYYLSD
jgi:hypothetical protein